MAIFVNQQIELLMKSLISIFLFSPRQSLNKFGSALGLSKTFYFLILLASISAFTSPTM